MRGTAWSRLVCSRGRRRQPTTIETVGRRNRERVPFQALICGNHQTQSPARFTPSGAFFVFNNTQRTVSAARAFARANSQCGHSKSIHMPDGSQEQKYYPCARLNSVAKITLSSLSPNHHRK